MCADTTSNTEQNINKNSNWWKRRSGLERALIIISISGFLLSAGLIIGIEVVTSKIRCCDSQLNALTSSSTIKGGSAVQLIGKDLICMSPECIYTATTILQNMDPEIDPCNNFYKFTCGGFLEKTVIPEDKLYIDAFSTIADNLKVKLRTSFEEDIIENETKQFKMIKNLYRSCMNETLIEEQGLQPLHQILRKLGGWPVLLPNWNPESFDWMEIAYLNRKIGYTGNEFIRSDINIDPKNSSRYIITLDQAHLSLSREFLIEGLENEIVQAYYNYMVDIAVILGADRDRAIRELRELLDFEITLANISQAKENRRNKTELYNPVTIGYLTRVYPSIPWVNYINRFLAPFTQIDEEEIVNLSAPEFLEKLIRLLEVTPKRVQANYVLWRVVRDSIEYLDGEVRMRKLAYSTKLTGETERKPRWEECMIVVANKLPLSVGALYVRKYFDEDDKKVVVEMIRGIREQLRKIIEKVNWMDEKTRAAALDKLDAMNSVIAYPDELLDNRKLENYYDGLDITTGNYLESSLNLTRFSIEYSLKKLRQPVNKSDWVNYGDSADVNAYYWPSRNTMQFPAGVLQGLMFSKNRPQYMNYGAIGYLMGHEITHGFDDDGSQYDKEGNVVEWWAPETKEKYLTRAKCIIDQYSNYTASEVSLNLNGVATQGENIADNGGIKEAYYAYNDWIHRNGIEPQLPGLNYNVQQMFWISAANAWCTKYRPEYLKMLITTGVHSPDEFRIVGPLSNMEEFAKDFKCPAGSKMNPGKKCAVW